VLFVIPVFFFWVRSWQHRGMVRREAETGADAA
jgi:hypothetical protein